MLTIILSKHLIFDHPQHEQVHRIEGVERVFPAAADEAALAVVEQRREETDAGFRQGVQEATAHDDLEDASLVQQIEGDQQAEAFHAVVAMDHVRDAHQPDEREAHAGHIVAEIMDGAHSEVAEEKRDEDALAPGQENGVIVHEVPRQLRDDGEYQKVAAVAEPVARVKEALHHEETEQRKSDAADASVNLIPVVRVASDLKQHGAVVRHEV